MKVLAALTLLLCAGCRVTPASYVKVQPPPQPDYCDDNYCNVGKKPNAK